MTTEEVTPTKRVQDPPIKRWLIPTVLVIVWVVFLGPLGSFAGQLSNVQENDSLSFLPETAQSTEVAKIQQSFAQADTVPAIVVYEFDGTMTPADQAAVMTDVEQIKELPNVTGQVIGPVISDDGQAATVVVDLATGGSTDPGEVVAEVRDITAESTASGGVYVTGPAGFLADLTEAFGEIDGLLLLVTLLVVLVILLIVYKSPILPILVLLTSVLALGVASAVIYWLADGGVITLNGQSQGILFILVIGAATDYSLLLVARYREELRNRASTLDAMKATLKGTYEAILASGGTVILGVLTLLLSELNSNKGLGPVAAIGIAFAMLAALTFLPAVLLLLGRVAFWPVRPKLHTADDSQKRGFWQRVSDLVGRKPRRVLLASLGLLVVMSAFFPLFKADGVAQTDFFMSSVESTEGQEALGRHFPAGSGSETVIATPVDELEETLSVVNSNQGVAMALPVTEAGPGTPPKVVDGTVLVEATLIDQADSAAAEATVVELREELATDVPEALVGGPTATQVDTQASTQRDLRVIIPAVLIVTLVVLMLLLRAVVAPILLIGTVIISFTATLGLAALVFYPIMGLPGADASVPLFAFVFLAALGIDYNIFLMTRAREESIKSGTKKGILVSLAVTGAVITSAGIVLAATFSALAILPLLFLFQIAFIVATGVLIDTLIVRSLLVPSSIYLIGDKSWWPSRLAAGADQRKEPESTTAS